MRVSTRLTLGFGLVSLLGVIIAGIGAWQMRDIANNLDEVANDRMIKVERFSRVKDNLNQIAIHARNVLVSSDQRQQEQEIARIRALRSENTEIITLLEKIVVLPRGKELLAVVTTTRGTYNGLLDQAIALDRQGKAQEAADLLLGPVVEKQAVIFKAVDESVSLQRDLANALAREAIGSSMRNTWTLGALALLIGLLGTAITTLVVRSLSRALGAEPAELGAAAERVSQGDLSPVAGAAEAPSGSVLAFLGTMQQGLAKVVAQVRTSSDSIATGSTQIASGNADLSQRTEEQASNLQQTAASMEEIASTVKSNAETSQQATALAQGAATAAQHGGELVGQVVTTMQQISDSSRRIADITATIDGIAFQTNILALNAAVEAARAGEQGRGFAVVAGEVRSLAQRAAGAAREIKALIGASVEKVTTGVEQADRAGSAMGEIVGQIQRVSQLITDMATATAEQSAGIGQVGDAVSQLDQVTQQNAALVEESAAAAESLRVQAVRLSEVVSTFKLGSSDAAGAALGGGATPTDERSRTAPARRLVSPPQPRLPSGSARAQPARAEAAAVDADWAAF